MNTSIATTATTTITELDAKLNSGEINQQEYDRRLRNLGKRLGKQRTISKTKFIVSILITFVSGAVFRGAIDQAAAPSRSSSGTVVVGSGTSHCSSEQGIKDVIHAINHSQGAKDNNLEALKVIDIVEVGHSPDNNIVNCEGTVLLNTAEKARMRYQFDFKAGTVLANPVE